MAPIYSKSAQVAPDRSLAAAREQFLTVGTVQPGRVRESIAASWWRSRSWKVAADRVQLAYVKDPNLETLLTRGATPVLDRLHEQIADEAVSVILTDPSGVVLYRRTADGPLERRLDRVQLAPGFSYAEQFVGTNGIGTALEGRQPTFVFGHEHYAEDLEDLGCAAAPIHDPVSGRMLGVLDLTCWSRDASPLLLALAKSAVEQIQHELTALTGLRQFALFQEYLRVCRRGSGIVFALNNDVVMMNEPARQLLSAADQVALLTAAAETVPGTRHTRLEMDLPSGGRARLVCNPVLTASGPAGGVVRIRLSVAAHEKTSAGTAAAHTLLPGLAGSSTAWQRACDQLSASYRTGEWVTVRGEAGTGKLSLLRAVHRHHNPTGTFRVLDAAASTGPADLLTDVVRELREVGGTLVLQHLDRLPDGACQGLAATLAQHRRTSVRTGLRTWVAATYDDAAGAPFESGLGARAALGAVPSCSDQTLTGLLRVFPASVEVPALRHHAEDIRELVPFLLVKLTSAATLTCSPATMRLLMRHTWPGNIAQLRQVLSGMARQRRSGTAEPTDLPPEFRAVSRRVLTPLESLERDAIVRALLDASGNKNLAAQALGLSRATIYRKIREYGIDVSI